MKFFQIKTKFFFGLQKASTGGEGKGVVLPDGWKKMLAYCFMDLSEPLLPPL
jgi:hypothetical protein